MRRRTTAYPYGSGQRGSAPRASAAWWAQCGLPIGAEQRLSRHRHQLGARAQQPRHGPVDLATRAGRPGQEAAHSIRRPETTSIIHASESRQVTGSIWANAVPTTSVNSPARKRRPAAVPGPTPPASPARAGPPTRRCACPGRAGGPRHEGRSAAGQRPADRLQGRARHRATQRQHGKQHPEAGGQIEGAGHRAGRRKSERGPQGVLVRSSPTTRNPAARARSDAPAKARTSCWTTSALSSCGTGRPSNATRLGTTGCQPPSPSGTGPPPIQRRGPRAVRPVRGARDGAMGGGASGGLTTQESPRRRGLSVVLYQSRSACSRSTRTRPVAFPVTRPCAPTPRETRSHRIRTQHLRQGR
ncbi:hypothetical protein SMICM304S_11453 [Streptomyces microflavus]